MQEDALGNAIFTLETDVLADKTDDPADKTEDPADKTDDPADKTAENNREKEKPTKKNHDNSVKKVR